MSSNAKEMKVLGEQLTKKDIQQDLEISTQREKVRNLEKELKSLTNKNRKSLYAQISLGVISLILTTLVLLIVTGIKVEYENNGSKISYDATPTFKSFITLATTIVGGGGGIAGIILAVRGKNQVDKNSN